MGNFRVYRAAKTKSMHCIETLQRRKKISLHQGFLNALADTANYEKVKFHFFLVDVSETLIIRITFIFFCIFTYSMTYRNITKHIYFNYIVKVICMILCGRHSYQHFVYTISYSSCQPWQANATIINTSKIGIIDFWEVE